MASTKPAARATPQRDSAVFAVRARACRRGALSVAAARRSPITRRRCASRWSRRCAVARMSRSRRGRRRALSLAFFATYATGSLRLRRMPAPHPGTAGSRDRTRSMKLEAAAVLRVSFIDPQEKLQAFDERAATTAHARDGVPRRVAIRAAARARLRSVHRRRSRRRRSALDRCHALSAGARRGVREPRADREAPRRPVARATTPRDRARAGADAMRGAGQRGARRDARRQLRFCARVAAHCQRVVRGSHVVRDARRGGVARGRGDDADGALRALETAEASLVVDAPDKRREALSDLENDPLFAALRGSSRFHSVDRALAAAASPSTSEEIGHGCLAGPDARLQPRVHLLLRRQERSAHAAMSEQTRWAIARSRSRSATTAPRCDVSFFGGEPTLEWIDTIVETTAKAEALAALTGKRQGCSPASPRTRHESIARVPRGCAITTSTSASASTAPKPRTTPRDASAADRARFRKPSPGSTRACSKASPSRRSPSSIRRTSRTSARASATSPSSASHASRSKPQLHAATWSEARARGVGARLRASRQALRRAHGARRAAPHRRPVRQDDRARQRRSRGGRSLLLRIGRGSESRSTKSGSIYPCARM